MFYLRKLFSVYFSPRPVIFDHKCLGRMILFLIRYPCHRNKCARVRVRHLTLSCNGFRFLKSEVITIDNTSVNDTNF